MKTINSLTLLAAALLISPTFANDPKESHEGLMHTHAAGSSEEIPVEPLTVEELPPYEAVTIYIDAKWGSRTKRAAKTISESHKEYAAKGYRVVDMDLYIENGDLRGFFVTYDRDND